MKINGVVIFVTGAISGAIASYIGASVYYQKKFDDRFDKAVKDMEEYYSNAQKSNDDSSEDYTFSEHLALATVKDDVDLSVAHNDDLKKASKVSEYIDYETYFNKENTGREDIGVKKAKPYVISPEEFRDETDWDVIEYTYWSDGVLTNEDNIPLSKEDIEMFVGSDALKHFGEYEDDSVFVKNDSLELYFEILYDMRPYEEVARMMPPTK